METQSGGHDEKHGHEIISSQEQTESHNCNKVRDVGVVIDLSWSGCTSLWWLMSDDQFKEASAKYSSQKKREPLAIPAHQLSRAEWGNSGCC